MKYIKTVMDSLSAITTSEAGQACLEISKAKTDEDRQKMLLRFSADFSDLDDLLGKADEALQVLNENRPQFDIDHCDKQTQPEYVREIADYLIKCSEVFGGLSEVLSRLSNYGGASAAELSFKYAETFNLYAGYIIKTYIKPEEGSDKGGQPKGGRPKGGKTPQTFKECIIDLKYEEDIRRRIEARLATRGKSGKPTATIIKAAVALGWIMLPNSATMKREFGITDGSGYSEFINETGGHRISDADVEAEKLAIQKV